MSSQEIKELVRRSAEEIWNKGNLDAADEVLSADHIRHDTTLPEPIRGVEAMKMRIAGLLESFPDGQITVEDIIVEGSKFANRWTFRGSHRGEFAGVPATGKEVTMQGTSFGRVEDGKIAEVWDLVDVMGVMQQLDVAPPPDRG